MSSGGDASSPGLPPALAGWRVAVTAVRRREEQVRLLQQAGAAVVLAGGGAADRLGSSPSTAGAVPDVCPVDALARRQIDAMTFTTTAAVDDLVARAGGHHRGGDALAALAGDVVPACLGPRCAQAAARAGMRGIVQADRLRLGALVQAVVTHFEGAAVRLRLHGYEVVLQGALARIGTEEVWLTGRERGVLSVLARRPGTVVGKDELLRSVWGSDEVEPHAVEVAVGRLRRRLGPAAGGLEAVPRRGYRLTAG